MKKKAPYARKRFGQHFLCDQSVIRKTIAGAEISATDHIIEIGPGRGALTSELLKSGAFLTVVEIDRDLSEELKQRFGDHPNFRLVVADILKTDWNDLIKADYHNKVIANLPYNISTPIFFRMVTYRKRLDSITIMVQKEVADRIIHQGEGKKLKDYGVLSVISNSVYDSKLLFKVSPGSFFPQPKVDSAVLNLKPKQVHLEQEELFFDFVRRAFNLRRKLLINHIRKNESNIYQQLTDKDRQFLENLRAENLTPNQFLSLFYQGRLEP